MNIAKLIFPILTSILFVTFLNFAVPRAFASTKATIARGDGASFKACYLTDQSGDRKHAILYKGLQVEVIGGSALTSWKVRVNEKESKVVLVKGWRESEVRGVGWVAAKYVTFSSESNFETDNSSDGNNAATDMDLSFSGMANTEGQGRASSSTENGSSSTGNGSSSTLVLAPNPFIDRTSPKNRPGNIYYLFACTGGGQEHFMSLITSPNRKDKKNHVWENVKADIKATGKNCDGVVCVKAQDSESVMRVLSQGLIPSGELVKVDKSGKLSTGSKSLKIYDNKKLKPSHYGVIGFCIVGHAGADGPFASYQKHKKQQLEFPYFRQDALSTGRLQGAAQDSFERRLVYGARLLIIGCNSGNCQYWDREEASLCHKLAALYKHKNVIVRGKTCAGSVNVPASYFATFGVNEEGLATRLALPKKEYKMLIADLKKVYKAHKIRCKTDEEAQALVEFYKSRDISIKRKGRTISVRAPKSVWLSRNTRKDLLLTYLVRALAGDEELADVKVKTPQLKKLSKDEKLKTIIEQVKAENDGRLDINDFRIWFHIYFGHYGKSQVKKVRYRVLYRACCCNDAKLTGECAHQNKGLENASADQNGAAAHELEVD